MKTQQDDTGRAFDTGGTFIAWTAFQRRAAVLAEELGVDLHFVTLRWEGANRLAKAASYLVKAVLTCRILIQARSRFLIVQLPPTPALYICAAYARLARIPLIADCHNAAIMEHWRHWPLTATLLSRAVFVVHNDHVAKLAAEEFGLTPIVLRTGVMSVDQSSKQRRAALTRFGLKEKTYVMLPWSLHVDEPIREAFDAMELLPDVTFVLTGNPRKLMPSLAGRLPTNLIMTGYLPTREFDELFSLAGAVLVLTTRDLTQLSGMAEAMAFEVPAVISDTSTTRYLYGMAPVYVMNNPESIRFGIQQALESSEVRIARLRELRTRTEKEFARQVAALREAIAGARS